MRETSPNVATEAALPAQPEMAERRGVQIASPIETQQIIRRMNAAYDWTGPDDPDNPRNFPARVRILSIGAISSLALVSTFAGAIYAPAQAAVMDEFHQNRLVAVLPLSLYNLGMACGPLVGAPLSETYGRKTVFVATTPIFLVFMVAAGFAKSITTLVICRFFAGIFASPNINNASATILDYVEHRHRGASLGIYYSLPSLGSTLAPLIGGFIIRSKGWRWTQWVAIIVTVAFYIPVLFTRETYKKSFSAVVPSGWVWETPPLSKLQLGERFDISSRLYNGFIFGLLYTFVISVPWIFRHYYDFNETGESLSYLGVTLGTLIACVPFVLVDFSFYQKRLRQWQQTHDETEQLPPENRLVSAMVGSFLLPASLLIAGWTAEYRISWFVTVFFQGISMTASLLIYAGANLFMLDAYGPLYGASASGAMMLSRVGDYYSSWLYFTDGADTLVFLGVWRAVAQEKQV
ncbi:polyamine transporter 4 [Fusarium albosuccineum]|uniref:Polyamine transporter 4 n=1 Tax=Fusarium albosuccineum TaxID=1237068 RepID=A0A8H4L1C8_9HYPO|nr:polyamine transporter 4 [Fusarium albosuccineum]